MKIIKSKKAYFQFVNTYEIKILELLNHYENKLAQSFQKPHDQPSSRHIKGEELYADEGEYEKKIIVMKDKFEYATHMVLLFEKLDMSLLDLLKIAGFQGFTLNVISKFGEQILGGLQI